MCRRYWIGERKTGGSEETYRLQPLRDIRNTLFVQEEAREEQTEQHNQHTNQIRNTRVPKHDADEEENRRGSEVEENKE
jgi:hypothetical protein